MRCGERHTLRLRAPAFELVRARRRRCCVSGSGMAVSACTRGASLARSAGMATLRETMTTHPITIHPLTTVARAVQLLQTLDFRHLPVVDERGALVGMVSDRDLRSLPIPVLVESETSRDVRGASMQRSPRS